MFLDVRNFLIETKLYLSVLCLGIRTPWSQKVATSVEMQVIPKSWQMPADTLNRSSVAAARQPIKAYSAVKSVP